MTLQTLPIVLIALCAVILAIGATALINTAMSRTPGEPTVPSGGGSYV